MRTTLDLADDVLFAAKEIARREGKTLGQTVSELARRAFNTPAPEMFAAGAVTRAPMASDRLVRYGIQPLQSRGGLISNAVIDRLRDEEGV